ncbi:MAG TPA: VOC family protein [bacterium]|nr:VOC family protein [bacterium]
MRSFLSRVDHLVLATPDVEATSNDLARVLGVRADPGGRHAAWGTRNALIALGDTIYLEIVGPDSAADALRDRARPFEVDRLREAKLVTWAASAPDLEAVVTRARESGIDLGSVQSRGRLRPDGVELKWKMTDPLAPRWDGIIPFFIDWGDTPHPAATSVQGGELLRMSAVHPRAKEARAILQALNLDLAVEEGESPKLMAVIRTTSGAMVEIR